MKRAAFTKPTIAEVRDYCDERDNTVDPQAFMDYYDSVGWKVGGKAAMKDWQAAVRTWERRESVKNPKPASRVADIRPGARYNATDGTISYDDE